MAARALVGRKRYFVDYVNVHLLFIQSFQKASYGQSTQYLDTRRSSSITSYVSSNTDHVKEGYASSFANDKNHLTDFSTLEGYRYKYYGVGSHVYQNGKYKNALPMASGFKLETIRHASIATAGQPDYDDDDDDDDNYDNEQVAAKKRKEASPEECDQAVVGLSTAKAKVKAKLHNSQKGLRTVLHKVWATLLGIGPALRAVASMSREDWAKKLVHLKDEIKSSLQHYWLGSKLLWADMRISSRLLLKLAGGRSLSRRERHQLTRTTTDIFRLHGVFVASVPETVP